jgi:Ni/Co efflux regulator RcnB
MKLRLEMAVLAAALLASSGSSAVPAQDHRDDQNQQGDRSRGDHNRFDEHDRQVTTDWYNGHKNHAPAGLRERDRLSSDQESRLHEGAPLDPDLRGRVHNAPSDLRHRLPAPASGNRYVTFGGHVGMIDRNYQVKDVIHLHDNHDDHNRH